MHCHHTTINSHGNHITTSWLQSSFKLFQHCNVNWKGFKKIHLQVIDHCWPLLSMSIKYRKITIHCCYCMVLFVIVLNQNQSLSPRKFQSEHVPGFFNRSMCQIFFDWWLKRRAISVTSEMAHHPGNVKLVVKKVSCTLRASFPINESKNS